MAKAATPKTAEKPAETAAPVAQPDPNGRAELALAEVVKGEVLPHQKTAFAGAESFELAQRMARCLAESDLVPDQYKGNLPNCILALEMSQRLGANPLMVMQNLYLVHAKPAWSSQFLIACINSCARFTSVRYALSGAENTDARTCVAYATDLATGERLESPAVSIGMAKAEGWYGRNGSKWKTMPELMLRYRSATLFARTYAPELTMGMRTEDELRDIEAPEPKPSALAAGSHSFRKPKPAVRIIDAEPAAQTADPEPSQEPAPTSEPSDGERVKLPPEPVRVPAGKRRAAPAF